MLSNHETLVQRKVSAFTTAVEDSLSSEDLKELLSVNFLSLNKIYDIGLVNDWLIDYLGIEPRFSAVQGKPGVVMRAFKPSTWEAEASRSL